MTALFQIISGIFGALILSPSALAMALALVFCMRFGVSAQAAPTAPNILVILADDAGYADFGFQGGGIHGDFAALTPNIDSIAAGGVRFTNGYVCGPVCCPSRASILTGRYQQRFGMEQNIQSEPNAGLATTQKTIADTLKASGYRTYCIGKWHLGQDLPAHHPNQRGFDEYFGFLSGARTYFQFTGVSDASKLQRNGAFLAEPSDLYTTDRFGAEAAAYIDDHVANHAGTRFFMYLAFNAVHTPMDANAARLNDARIQSITPLERKTNAAKTIALDDAVGVVLSKLNEYGLTTDTLIVFLSDNGGPEDNLSLNAPNWSDNGPLRGTKTMLYEGGIRVPFAVKWPAAIPSLPGGRAIDDPVMGFDLLPTFVAAANTSLLAGQETDGVSLLPRLTGYSPTPIQRCLFWRTGGSTGGQSAVRKGDWKLYRQDGGGPVELYNLASDIGETIDLATSMPEKVAELEAEHALWERGVIEPQWGGGEMTLSAADLTLAHATIGYEAEKTSSGIAYAYHERRDPLPLDSDWTLDVTIERFDKGGLSKNAFVVLGATTAQSSFVRLGIYFNQARMTIQELGSGDYSEASIGTVPGSGPTDYRINYDSAAHMLRLKFNDQAVTHTLSATYLQSYTAFNYSGYGIGQTATRFSPINRYLSQLAQPGMPTWARLQTTRDYTPGTTDTNGAFMGGTELMSLVPHNGKLYAGVGYWNDLYFGAGSPDPHPGPQVLVKESAAAPWKQDFAAGPDHLRIECLRSLSITTDKNGAPLTTSPVTLLLAGSGELSTVTPPRRATVFIRNDSTNAWAATYPGSVTSGTATTRMIFDHVDSVTGIHNVFVGYGGSNASIVRGGYNAATGLIDWVTTPELTGTERVLSAGECNGWLYACIGSNGVTGDDIGGIFWREDGPSPQWHFVCEWPVNTKAPDIRGFTAVPHPQGFDYDVALVTLESFGKLYWIDPLGGDPRNGHLVHEELNIQQFLGDQWNNGVSIGYPTLSAYNDMPEVIHPATQAPVNLIGVAVNHPNGPGTPERDNAWFLVRHHNATYEWGQIIDPAIPSPNGGLGLRACRALRLSPFPEEGGRVLYMGGYDAASQTGPVYHNTAWLYRGRLENIDNPASAADAWKMY